MSVDRLQKIEERIEKLNIQKQRLTVLSKTKNSKLLTKQKILVGAYMLSNSIPKMSQDQRMPFLKSIKDRIPDSRKSDLFAINELIQQYGETHE
jgi:hypothetical protein